MVSQCVSYVMTEAFCAVFAVSVLIRLDKSIGSEHEIRELRNLIFAYLVMLATDSLWTLFNNDVLRPALWLNIAVNLVLLLSISLGCYFWYMFIQDRLHQTRPVKRSVARLQVVPIIVVAVLDVVSAFTGLLFYVDGNGHYQSTGYFLIQSVVNYFYLVVPTAACVWRSIKARQKSERREFTTYAMYMLAPIIGGLMEEVAPLVPFLSLSMFMVILIFFLMIQNMRIYNDALTGLNNRRRLSRYLEERLQKADADNPVIVLMMDINRFKYINDNYGHIEGDNALRRFAGVLKEAAAPYRAFISRYGGDEFCLVASGREFRPEDIADSISGCLKKEESVTSGGAPYSLTVSIGFAACDSPVFDPAMILSCADKMLYERKEQWHRENG